MIDPNQLCLSCRTCTLAGADGPLGLHRRRSESCNKKHNFPVKMSWSACILKVDIHKVLQDLDSPISESEPASSVWHMGSFKKKKDWQGKDTSSFYRVEDAVMV